MNSFVHTEIGFPKGNSMRDRLKERFFVTTVLSSLQVSVYLQNWSHVQSYVNKAEGTPEVTEVRIS